MGWISTTSVPAARSFFASLPSRRPEARWKTRFKASRGLIARMGWRVEVGLRQMTRSSLSSRRMSALDAE